MTEDYVWMLFGAALIIFMILNNMRTRTMVRLQKEGIDNNLAAQQALIDINTRLAQQGAEISEQQIKQLTRIADALEKQK